MIPPSAPQDTRHLTLLIPHPIFTFPRHSQLFRSRCRLHSAPLSFPHHDEKRTVPYRTGSGRVREAMTTEKKRKLPPRAAARSEQAAKRRQTDTPPTSRKSSTPAPAPPKEPEPEPAVEEPPKQTLPSSVTAGKPLPTVEEPQPEDLSTKDYQTLQERCAALFKPPRVHALWLNLT